MKTPLVQIDWPSIYAGKTGPNGPLPKRMAQCTPDMKVALQAAAKAVEAKGGKLILSDLFRSYQMQYDAHQDFVTGRKKANSPPPGGSFHEAGRAFDMDLAAIHIPLADFWKLVAPIGLVPIIDQPKSGASESWHFECRGSHQRVYDYYKAGKGNNFDKPYKAAAASAILSVGIKVDKFGADQDAAYVQAGLIRLGDTIGNLDGDIGQNTKKALAARNIPASPMSAAIAGIDQALKAKFPGEF
jgi:hypothetical protein